MEYTDIQVMVTLATMAYLDLEPMDPPPSGATNVSQAPTVVQQQQALYTDISCMLTQDGLATPPNAWTVPWVGLTDDQANFAFIAENSAANQLAVVLRGSVFRANPSSAGPIDVGEDMDVSRVKPWTFFEGQPAVTISKGAFTALTEITTATCQVDTKAPGMNGTTLLEALTALNAGTTGGPTIYVTGHSLGGCMTTTVALYLLGNLPDCVFQVYNFAGPSAGLADFADLFDANFGAQSATECSSWRVVNIWDAVPHAWETLRHLYTFYPKPGPSANAEITAMIAAAHALPGHHKYKQPGNAVKINFGIPVNYPPPDPLPKPNWELATRDENITGKVDKQLFLDQVAFQHFPNFTYMPLLGAPALGDAMAACDITIPEVLGSPTPPPSWSNDPPPTGGS